MDRLRSAIAPFLTACAKVWIEQMANGLRNSQWAEKLSGMLWAYRTTKRVPTGEMPFSLAYGMEVIIPVDISMPTLRAEGVVKTKTTHNSA